MIQILIRTIIFDKCINIIFDTLSINFPINNKDLHLFPIGTCCTVRLIIDGRSLSLERCKITYNDTKKVKLICEAYDYPLIIVITNGVITELLGDTTPIRQWVYD